MKVILAAISCVVMAATATAEPADQKQMTAIADKYCKSYDKNVNELKKTAQRMSRRDELQKLESLLEFKDWTAVIEDMSTTSSGKAMLKVRIEDSCMRLKNHAMEAMFADTMIPFGSDLYNALAEMSKGDRVLISGKLLRSKQDFFMEASYTTDGSMTEPEFVAKFTAIKKR